MYVRAGGDGTARFRMRAIRHSRKSSKSQPTYFYRLVPVFSQRQVSSLDVNFFLENTKTKHRLLLLLPVYTLTYLKRFFLMQA